MGLFRSSHVTVVFVDATRALRLDVDPRSGRVLDTKMRPRPIHGELTDAVELVMQAGSRGGKTWILTTEVWSHRLAVSAAMMEGLSEAETARALAFEAESLSGISAIDSEVGFVALANAEGSRQLWVTQASARLRDQLQATVRLAGGKLEGILHPAGLPGPLATDGAANVGDWNRCEAWPGLTVAVQTKAGRIEHRFLNTDRRNTGIETSDAWTESLQAGGTLPANIQAAHALRLDHDPSLIAWLAAWGVALANSSTPVPKIRPLPQPMGNAVYVAASLVLAAVVAGLSFWDYRTLVQETQTATTETTSLNRRTDELKTLNAEMDRLTKQTATNETASKSIEQVTQEVESQMSAERQRWQKLLQILANTTSAEWVIQEISSTNGIVTIRGKCLGTQATSESASAITEAIRPLGWIVTPRQKTSQANNLYDFSFQLEDTTPKVANAKPAPPAQVTQSLVPSPKAENDSQ